MKRLPESTNLHGVVDGPPHPRSVADLFGSAGWEVRKCGRDEYEATCAWAELVIEASGPILVHGLVADVAENMKRIAEVLRAAEGSYRLEGYAADGTLLHELRSA